MASLEAHRGRADRGREATHQRILRTSERLFAAGGYDATGVAEICVQAGLSKGAFYHHFPSKQALFQELLATWLSALDQALDRAEAGSTDVPVAIRGMSAAVAEGMERPEIQLPMILEFWAQARRDPVVWQAVVEPYHRYQLYFETLLKRGVLEGSLRSIDPGIAARGLVSMALGLLLQAMFDPDAEDWGAVFLRSVDLYLEGLLRRAE